MGDPEPALNGGGDGEVELPRSRHCVLLLALVILVGSGLRLGALVFHPPLDIDEARYLITAHHVRHGLGYADWRGPEIDILPLHPLMTAALSDQVETLEWSGRAVTCVSSIVLLVALAIFALRLAGMHVALVASSMAAFHPWLVRSAARPDPESLYGLLVMMALMGLRGIMSDQPGPRRWGWSGLGFGLAYLTRPEGFLVAVLVGFMAAVAGSGTRRDRVRGLIRFAGILALTAAPYLIWLHGAAGRWTLTGKSADVFFIGQAIHAAGGQPIASDAYVALREQYGSVLGYTRLHPIDVLARIVRFGLLTFGWILPRALGPLGLVGGATLAVRWLWAPRRLSPPIWVAAPAIMLGLLPLAVPEERVVGSIIPFLIIPAAYGLTELWSSLRSRHWRRSALASVATILLAVPWCPAVARSLKAGRLHPVEIERAAAARALELEPDVSRIANNSPVVSCYLRDPRLFGPPGQYEPLPFVFECDRLSDAMKRRGARVAILDQWAGDRAIAGLGPGCSLQAVATLRDADARRRVDLIEMRTAP